MPPDGTARRDSTPIRSAAIAGASGLLGTALAARLQAVAWECAAESAVGSRVVLLRTGIVLTPSGGALAKMLFPFKLGLGGRIGSGTQWMSWISLGDWVRAASFLLTAETVQGPVNIVA